MAAPKEKSLQDLSGKWRMNGQLSDDVDGVLVQQGFSYFMRTAIAYSPVYLSISQTKEGSNTKYTIEQSTTADIPGVNEEWTTDWQFRTSEDPVMSEVQAKARWSKPGNVDDSDYLAGGWLDEGEEQIEAVVESFVGGWTAHQIWGFEEFDGQRMFVRRVVVKKDDTTEKVKLVYDFESS